MRILTVEPGFVFSVQDVHNGWTRAFRGLGHEVHSLNLADRIDFFLHAELPKEGGYVRAATEAEAYGQVAKDIEVACYEFWPDLVFITSGFFIPRFTFEVLRDRGHQVVLLHTEEPYEFDRQFKMAPYVSLNLLNDPTNLEQYREVGRAEYQWHCYDPDVHRPMPPSAELASDFAFVGTGFPSRMDFFEKVNWSGIDATFAGNWQKLGAESPLRPLLAHDIDNCVDNADAVGLYSSTKLSANLYRVEAQRPELSEGWAMGPREVELAACGTPFLRQRRGEGDELLGFLPTFETPAEFEDMLRFYLARPDARSLLAHKAREVLADRTFTNAARRLLTLLER